MRAITIVVAVSACGGSGAAPVLTPAASAVVAPALDFPLLSGARWSSRDAAGRVIVLDVWATYCAPCRQAFPKLGRLAAAYPDAVVIGLSVDDDDAVVRGFLDEVPAGFPIARDPTQTVQSGPLAIHALPAVLVIDRRGRTRFRRDEMTEPDYDALPGVVAALLAE